MNASLLIDLFEAKISGEQVTDYLLSMGTSGGFFEHTLKDVLDRKFDLKKVSITEIRRLDPAFNEWLERQELSHFGLDEYSPTDLRKTRHGPPADHQHRPDAPVIIVDGKLRDGWHRTARAFALGEWYVNAYVA